ncbi:adenosylmethionine decarboxylase [Desulfotignum phosphitoxidans]|uniref:S-adenosylmethionine decarboxylase proenzyme n=1 Tax=Desulfotignum phosphitoxidans DSM 13687 TaxID=1286635 RepID=S0FQC9_9BACT|nr:adenosylmethionine decarboxylase [Desulfotignum phosphitoxidans]EMS77273.1 S-adenosylmethionine decarboxylase proenzyme [Desulfotignum phosphitoxidans DSM 13687]
MLNKNLKMTGDVQDNNFFALGRQVTIEYYECGATAFLDAVRVEDALLKAAKDSNATIISSSFHQFEPQGVSGVVVIAESHFTIHAWPEHDYAAVDIFTCGDNINLEAAITSMKESFESKNVLISSDQNRGIISKPFAKQHIGQTLKHSNTHPISWKKDYEQKNPWGVLSSIDIYDSDPDIIRDADKIKQFVHELCDKIEMKRFGECQVVHFGEDERVEGFSMTQLIETSLISGHFANADNTVYLDVFSCKFYDPREVAEFAMSFFKGGHYKMQLALRQ